MKILITAFDPFGGDKINPALEAVKKVNADLFKAEVIKLEIPTVFGKSIKKVAAAMKKENPDVVLCIGQAGGRFDITPERVAINVDDARITDNEGNQPIDQPIFKDGAPAYFSLLPIKAMVQNIREVGLPASVSNSAGTFVCNHIMYGVLYHIHKTYPHMKGGFIHVPFIPEQVVNRPNAPAMSLNDITHALEVAVQTIIDTPVDIKAVGGKTH
ncbi:MAG: pyroglutamyl-peptidase I [Anaerolineaceae bacterium]|nr:pyroglutamyl-peptidase I [Anaerolineaceae bacterium]